MKSTGIKLFLLLLVVALASLAGGHSALAASSSSRIIDDSVFDNVTTMNASQIDSWLNSFPNSCISTKNGFTANEPTAYSPWSGFVDGHYQYGAAASAGKIIYDISQAYSINPQVLLTKLENEENLVTGNSGCASWRYASAVGYNCPDSLTLHNYSYTGTDPYSSGYADSYNLNDGSDLVTPLYYINGVPVNSISSSCVNHNYNAGFSEQLIHMTWMLSYSRHKSEGQVSWAVITGSWNHCDDNNTCNPSLNIPSSYACYPWLMTQGNYKRCPTDTSTVYYDGYTTIDGQSLLMSTGGTAALYVYTPHIQSFDSIFENWFGPATGPEFAATYDSQSYSYQILDSGAKVNVFMRFRNTGYAFWKDDYTNFTGWHPVHLAATKLINRQSPFAADNWPAPSRATDIISKVYNADGTLDTTPADQHTVLPGQIGEFDFTLYANPNIPSGVYREYFQPIIENSSSWNMGTWAYFDVGMNHPNYQAAYAGESAYPTIPKGNSALVIFKLKNTGTAVWQDDTDLQPGRQPVHFAASWPINRISIFDASWLNPSRPNVTFSKVYESDGTTLASSQHTVQPGQIAEFDLGFTTPSDAASGTYIEHFQPIVEGAPGWNMGGDVWTQITVP